MTLDEFKALKAGDTIRNSMTSAIGTIVGAETRRGRHVVDIRWHQALLTTTFTEQSTAWMHWAVELEDVE